MSENTEPVPAPENEPKLKNAHKFLIESNVDVDEDYAVFEKKMQDDEKLSNLHKYFKKANVDVDEDFEVFKTKMRGAPVKKKDFGSALPTLGTPSVQNSVTDRLKPRITFDDPQLQKLTKLKTDQKGNPVRIGEFGVKLFANGRAQSPDGKTMGDWDLVDGKVVYKFPEVKSKPAPVRKQNPNITKADATDVRTPKQVMQYATPKVNTGDEGFETGLFRGLQGYDQGTQYANILLNESKADRIKFASGEFAKAQARNQELADRGQMDQETPMMSWTGFGELLGGVMKPIVATVAANTAAPIAGTATAVIMGMHNGAGSAYQRAFMEAKAKGWTDEMADDVAIKMAGIGSVAGAAENLIGVKTGPAMKYLEKIGSKISKRAAVGKAVGIGGEATADAAVGAGLQFGQNVSQNALGLPTDLSAGVKENAMGEYIFGAVGAGATALKFANLNIKGKLQREDAKSAIQEQTFSEMDAAIPENPEEPITDTSIRTPLQAREQAQALAKENGFELAAGMDPMASKPNNPLYNEPNEIAWKLMNQDVSADDIDDLELQKSYEWMQEVANRIDHLEPEEKALTLNELADGMTRAQEILDEKLAKKKPDVADQVEDMRSGAAPVGKVTAPARVRLDAYGDPIVPREGQKVIFQGKEAEVKIDGQIVTVETDTQIHEIGNIEEVTDLSKHGVSTVPEYAPDPEPEPEVFKFEGKVNDDYSVEVRGQKYTNRYSDKGSAINRNAEGKAISVTLDTEDGKKRTFTDKNVVQHIAEQYYALSNPAPIVAPVDAVPEMEPVSTPVPEAEPVSAVTAEQKTGLLPEEFSEINPKPKVEPEPIVDTTPAKSVKPVTTTKAVVVKAKKITTPDEQIADAKKKLSDLFSGKTGKAYDITGLGVEVTKALGELAIGYARKGVINAKDFVTKFREDFPDADVQDQDLERIFESNKTKAADRFVPNVKPGKGDAEFVQGGRLDPKNETDQIAHNLGMEYIKKGRRATESDARKLIAEVGPWTALQLVTNGSNNMNGSQRIMTAVALKKHFDGLAAKAPSKTEAKKLRTASAQATVMSARIAGDASDTMNAMKAMAALYEGDPEAQKAKQRAEAAADRDSEIEKRQLENELNEAYEIIEDLKQKIAEVPVPEIKPETLVPNKKRVSFSDKSRKSISDWFDSFKVPVGKTAPLSSFLVPPAILNAGIDVIKKAVLMGFDVSAAVSRGIYYINSKHNAAWDEAGFEEAITKHAEEAAVYSPAKQVAERVLNHVAPNGAKVPDPVQRMINILFNKAKQHLPNKPKNKPLSALEQIVFMMENYDIFRGQFQEAQTEVMNWVNENGTPQMVNDVSEFVMAMSKFPMNENTVTKVTKGLIYTPTGDPKVDAPALRKAIRELAASHYSSRDNTRETLATKLASQLGLAPSLANIVAFEVKKNFDSLMVKEQAKFLAEKTRLKTLTPRKKKDFFEQLVEASNMGALTDEAFRDAFAKAHDIPVLSEQQWQQLDNLADKAQEYQQILKEDEAGDGTDPKAENARKELLKIYRDAVNIKEHAPGAGEVYMQTMQLQTLGIMTMFNNLFGNVAYAPVGIAQFMVEGVLDKTYSLINKDHKRTTAVRASFKGGFLALGHAFGDTWFHLVHGTTNDKITNIHRNFGMSKGFRNVINPHLSTGQRVGGVMEMIFAIPNKIISKGLIAGDNPVRKIVEGATARKLGVLQGKTGKELEKFIKYPDAVSAELIKHAGESAVFQATVSAPDPETGKKDNKSFTDKVVSEISNAPDWLDKSLSPRYGDAVGSTVMILAKTLGLYVRIPVNLARMAISLGMPEIHAIGMVKAAISKDATKFNKHLSKFTMGLALHGVALSLINSGLLTGSDEDESEKQRSANKFMKPPHSLNFSALSDPERLAAIMWNSLPGTEPVPVPVLETDVWMEYKKIPVIGPVFSAKADANKEKTADMGWLVTAINSRINLGAGVMDQGIFTGALSVVEALKEKGAGPKMKRLIAGMFETLTNPIVPKTLKDISMATDEFKRDAGGEVDDMMRAVMIQRLKGFGVENDLPMKFDAWGDPVKAGVMGSSSAAYYLYDPMKLSNPDESGFKYQLALAAASSGNMDYLPSVPSKKQDFSQVAKGLGEIELSPEQYAIFSRMVGQERKKLFIERGQDMNPDRLPRLYEVGMKRAKKRFAKTL